MIDTACYLVTEEIAERSGLIDVRYRVRDGRFVLDKKDLERIRFTADEFINGLDGVEKIDDATAKQLISENGNQMGRAKQAAAPSEEPPLEQEQGDEENQENQENEETEETSGQSETTQEEVTEETPIETEEGEKEEETETETNENDKEE